MRLIDFFDKAVAAHPERPAFIAAGEHYTYAEMHDFSSRIAAAMVHAGLVDQARAAVYSPNNVSAFACVLAIFRSGATWVPINARNATEANIDFMSLTGCEWLFYHSSFAETAARIRQDVPTLKHLVCLDHAGGGDASLAEFIAAAPASLPQFPVTDDPHRMVSIIGSGGTTGQSKGVRWDNLTWETLIAESGMCMPGSSPIVHLCAAPMTHAAGVLAFMLMPRAPLNVIMDRVDPEQIMENIQRHSVTHLFLPPTALYAMLAHPRVREYDYSSLTHFLIAASPVAPDKLAEAVEIFGPCMCQCYGQVEAPMLITYLPPEDIAAAARDVRQRHRLLSCGRVAPLVMVEIVDEDGVSVPVGDRGEIVVRGNLVAPCYYRNAEATAEAQQAGWLHTGDIGYRDDEGYVYIVDRKKDMIITGGFNVFSAEVENCINGHAAVENCAVIGVPDPRWGEAVKAVIALKAGQQASAEEIIQYVKEKLGGVKAPKSVEFWTELPRSPVGKVLKNDIRGRFWKGAKRAVN